MSSAVCRGATEDLVAKLQDYVQSDLPERTKAALRLADRVCGERPTVDAAFYVAIGVLRRRLQERFQMLIDHAVQHAVLGGAGLIPGKVVGHADDVGAVSGG